MKNGFENSDILTQMKVDAVGVVPRHWQVRLVAELIASGVIAKIQDGNHGEIHPVSSDYVSAGIPFIMSGAIRNGRVDVRGCKFLHRDHARSLRVGHAKRGDVLLTHKGNFLGRTAVLRDSEQAVLTPQVTYYRIKSPGILAPEFLRWVFQSPRFQHQFKRDAQQSTRPFVSISNQQKLYLPIPPIDEQLAIAHILDTLDNKIELNRRMNETLEVMARALFKSWFLDFNPVRAKAERRDPGLPTPLADLFPDSFEDSELGQIPEGWEVSFIYRAAEVVYGAAFSSAKFNTDRIGTPLIRIRDLADENPGFFTDEEHPKGYLVRPGDIVVGMDGEFRAHLWGGVESWLNQRVCVFKPKVGFSAPFVLHSIVALLAEVESTETATTVIHLGKNDIDRFKTVVPAEPPLSAFSRFADPLFQRIVVNKQESRTLAALRDALLPKLISGELRIPVAERLVDRAL